MLLFVVLVVLAVLVVLVVLVVLEVVVVVVVVVVLVSRHQSRLLNQGRIRGSSPTTWHDLT